LYFEWRLRQEKETFERLIEQVLDQDKQNKKTQEILTYPFHFYFFLRIIRIIVYCSDRAPKKSVVD